MKDITIISASLFLLFSLPVLSKNIQNTASGNKSLICLLTLLPYYNPDPSLNPVWTGGDNIQPAMELAKDQINSNPSILENYTLELIHAQSGCDKVLETRYSFSKEAFPRNNSSVRRLTGIIGPGCSSSSIALAPLTNRAEIGLVMVHVTSSPILANRIRYPFLLSTLGLIDTFVDGFDYLLKKANWNRVAILYDDSNSIFRKTRQKLGMLLSSNEVAELDPSLLASLNSIPLKEIQKSLVRIIFVMCQLQLSLRTICLSQKRNMTYDKYQWVFMTNTLDELVQAVDFTYRGVHYNCSEKDMAEALEKSFLLIYDVEQDNDVPLVSNITFDQYLQKYKTYRDQYNQRTDITTKSNYSHLATPYYDAVWAWALVLDNLTKTNASFDVNGGYYGNLDHSRMMVEQFYQTLFQGASGEIEFNRDTGFTQHNLNIFQIRNGTEEQVAIIGKYYINNITEPMFIPDTFPYIEVRNSKALAVSFNLITAIQFLIVVILHVATVINLKQPSIKASSPRLFHITYTGVYIVALGAFTWTLFSAASIRLDLFGAFCQFFWAWCLPIGFTLSFGPVAMRTWRIYRIFVHYDNPGPLISDPILFCGVLLLLLVDVIIAVIWTVLDTQQTQYFFDKNLLKRKAVCACVCEHNKILWLSIIVLYKVGLFIIVTVLALLTRGITIKSFATTALRVFVYVMTLFSLLGFSLYFIFAFNINPNYDFVTISLLLNSIITLFIVCIFIPPLVPVFKFFFSKYFHHY